MTINDKYTGGQQGVPSTTPQQNGRERTAPAIESHITPQNEVPDEALPPYGREAHSFELSRPGLEAGAAVTGDGRVNININQKNRRLAELLAPVITSQAVVQPSPPPAYFPPSIAAQPGQKPPSSLNVVIQIVGSRGDVQPFVALGKVLKEVYGHRVRIATHPTFQGFVEENGLDFFSIGGDPAELMAFMVKHPGLMPGFDAIKSGEIRKRREGVQAMLLGCWRSCIEAGNGLGPPPQPHGKFEPWDPAATSPGVGSQEPFVADAIIANPPSFAHIHIAEKLGIPLHMMFTMPWSPTRAFPHPLANVQSTNADTAMTNYLTYRLVEMLTWQGLGDVINRFREKALDLPSLEMIWAPGLLQRLKISYTYCWSPSLIPKPNDWGPHIDIAGFFFLNLASSYSPDSALAAFLEAGPPPVYIGFGSIVVDDPNAMTRLIFDAIHLAGVRALVSKGWGGLGADAVGAPEGVFMLGNVPHDWLFERVSCVVHHGGAGTTAAGIKAGKPTIVVPFFGDQPFWGAMIARAKAGPDPIPHADLTAEKLAEAIRFCLRPETQRQAMDLGEKIREERGAEAGAQSFHRQLNFDVLRCSVAPSRTAVWRVRRTSVRLSPLAAEVLVDKGLIQYTDLKLHQPCEYITEGQPPEPITAGASAIMADLSSIGMSLFADMPQEMFRSRRRTDSKPRKEGDKSNTEGTNDATSRRDISRLAGETHSDVSSEANSQSINDQRDDSRELLLTPSSERSVSPLPPSVTSADRISTLRRRGTHAVTASTLDASVIVSKGVGRAVVTGVKSPMNFCLGLAKGFRNLPLLYNDDTIREVEKVTDLSSGVKIASKELGLGFYDGVSGLVTQPLRGGQKDGVGGFVKGFGKGIGGLIAKPAAGIWGLPAYLMQGAYAEVNKLLARSAQNYIKTSRVVQGRLDFEKASDGERADIIHRWKTDMETDLKDYYLWKKKESVADKAPARGQQTLESLFSRAQASWPRSQAISPGIAEEQHLQTRSYDNAAFPQQASAGVSSLPNADEQYEEAIRTSVRETSRGNAQEDAVIETAVREGVNAARQQGALPDFTLVSKDTKTPTVFEDADYQITDEEYQDLVAQATQESLAHQARVFSPDQEPGLAGVDRSEDAEQELTIQESRQTAAPALPRRRSIGDEQQEDEDLQRAIAASRDDMARARTERTEDEIVLEYVKRQSLAEEAYRRQHVARQSGQVSGNDENDDDELKRAIEESLQLSENGRGLEPETRDERR